MTIERIKNGITTCGSTMLKILKQIFIGRDFRAPDDFKPTYDNLRDQLKSIWNGKSIGLTRMIKLSLVLIQFVNPFSPVCSFFDRKSSSAGALFTDGYVILKLLIPLVIYKIGISTCIIWFISWYIIIETTLYLVGVVLLSTDQDKAISPKRSFVMLLVNYFTIILSFAAIYRIPGLIQDIRQPTNAVYFSFVISSTLGLGEYVPSAGKGEVIVILQIITSILFLTVFFTHFLSRLHGKGD